MSGQEGEPKQGEGHPRQAVAHPSRWPGWIWAVPIAAVAIVAWLGFRSLVSGGPELTVVFPVVANVKAGSTSVKFQGVDVGEVESTEIEKDLTHMRVKLSLHSDMDGQVGKGTRFWIIGENFSLSNLSGIKSILSGPSIGIDPRPGRTQSQYVGLARPPVLKFGAEGTEYVLHTGKLGTVGRGTSVYYLGEKVGEVQNYRMVDGRGFDVKVFIDAPYDRLVHAGTRFWNESAVRLSTGGAGPALQFHSLPALVEGAIGFETPFGPAEGPPASSGEAFTLYEGRDAAEYAPDKDGVAYRVVFHGASSSLSRNAAVKLMGTRVGTVSEARFVYDPASGQVSIDATIVLEPSRITLAGGRAWTNPRAQMDALMQRLVGQGLRAELTSSPPVIGGTLVSLHVVQGEGGALGSGAIPEIPSLSSGSGISGIMAKANDVMTKLDGVPIAQIGNNVDETTQRLAALAKSPATRQTLRNADRAVANVDEITRDASRQVPATLSKLRQTVSAAEATLRSTQGILSANGSSAPQSGDLPGTLYEVTRAARSLRELADFLDRHPAALVTGRGAKQ